jgi:hypothetical protein
MIATMISSSFSLLNRSNDFFFSLLDRSDDFFFFFTYTALRRQLKEQCAGGIEQCALG